MNPNQGITVLLAEDDEPSQLLMRSILKPFVSMVYVANDGSEGIEIYIAEDEPIFSADDADIILHIMKLQQKEQKEKDEKV